MNTAIALPVDVPAVVPPAGATRVPAGQAPGQGFGQCLALVLFPQVGTQNQVPAMSTQQGETDPATQDAAESPANLAPPNEPLNVVPEVAQASASVTPAAPVVATAGADPGTSLPPVSLMAAEPDATAKPASPGRPNAAPITRGGRPDKDDKAPAPTADVLLLPVMAVVPIEPPAPRESPAAADVSAATIAKIDRAAAKPHTQGPDDGDSLEIVSPSSTPPPTHGPGMSGQEPAAWASEPHLPAPIPTESGVQPLPMPLAPAPAHDSAAVDASTPASIRASSTEQVGPAIVSLGQMSGGARHVTVQLQPTELGQVQIRIVHMVDAAPRIEISAERPQTLALLQRDEVQLHRALDQAGITPEGRALTFHLSPADTQNGIPPSRTGDAMFDMAGQRQGNTPHPQSQPTQSGSVDDTEAEPQPLPVVARWLRAGIDITA